MLNYTGVSFFAEVHRVTEAWPDMTDARDSAIVLRVRGLPDVPSSGLLKTLERYGNELGKRGSRLILAGVHPQFAHRLKKAGIGALLGVDALLEETDEILRALDAAYDAAMAWVVERRHDQEA